MSAWVSIDGVAVPAEQARISVLDNGFILGDGVYDTLRTYGGRPFRLDLHLDRLRRSAARIGVDIPLSDQQLAMRLDDVLARAENAESYIRFIITRGIGDATYHFEQVVGPTIVILIKPFESPPAAFYDDGIPATIVSVRRNAADAADPAIKSCSLLNSVLAAREAQARGGIEAILLDARGNVAEGAASNVFAVRGDGLHTPPLDTGILAGIAREIVIDLARESATPVREEPLAPESLRAADEAFLTSSIREVMPISSIDGEKVGTGRPGPVTKRLLGALQDYARRHSR